MDVGLKLARREFFGASSAALLAACAKSNAILSNGTTIVEEMYGLIAQMKAVPGKRSELIAILYAGTRDIPGNQLYLIAEDLDDPDAIWITEVWNTKTDHANSLQLPAVQEAIAKGRPLIEGMGMRAETKPLGFA